MVSTPSTLACDAVPAVLFRERGYRDNTFYYHLGDGSHAYHYNLETTSSIYFKCVMYHQLGCGGRAILKMGGEFRHSHPHNHLPDPEYVGEKHFRQNVLDDCRGRFVDHKEILDQARRDRRYSRRVRSKMTMRRLRNSMNRARMGQMCMRSSMPFLN
ncbi:Keratin, type II cytoskeletal 2 epidermal [Frankliniella fusca]|uniref:Keratin, type II cytoskeletal 2 epidermal n=1 Tax=Frankliniella fusca TaxID=407009 RepID=A0AAE1HMN2_9NEOP|nr:Keratin, type II cytoskeletal 2 epidermal [Frankliniella fusca]